MLTVNIWNASEFAQLTPAKRRAVERRKAEGETAVDYLNRVGAGVATVDSYEDEDRAANRAALAEAADTLFDAGIPAQVMMRLGVAYAAATPEAQAIVAQALAPFMTAQ